jgi:hypothetical protein
MEMWKRLDSLKRSWEFVVLGKLIRNKGRLMGVPSGDLLAIDICLTLITLKSRSTSPSTMPFSGVF